MSEETRYFFLTSDSGGDEVADSKMVSAVAGWALEEFGGESCSAGDSVADVEADLLAGKPVRLSVPDLESRGVVFGDDHPPTVPQLMEWLEVEGDRARELLGQCGIYSGDVFVLRVTMGNAAMSKPEHVAESLRSVAKQIEDHARLYNDHDTQIRDINGLRVGGYQLVSAGEAS